MTQSNKEEIYKKWSPILDNIGITGPKADWMAEYAQLHQDKESKRDKLISSILPEDNSNDLQLLPVAMKLASKTIGLDIVSVQPLSAPMGMGNSSEELERIKAEVKSKNREGKIESVLEGKEYKEKSIKDHPDYKEGGLFYLDYNYNSGKKTRRSGKKHKKKNNGNNI